MRKFATALLPSLILSAAAFAQAPNAAPTAAAQAPAAQTATAPAPAAQTAQTPEPPATPAPAAAPAPTPAAAPAPTPAAAPAPAPPAPAPAAAETPPPPATAPAAAPTQPDHEASKSYRLAVNFEPNSLDLTPLSAAALDSMSAVFARNKRHRFEVHGYSCPVDAAAKGKVIRLSTQRVERMVDHLLSLGVPGENIVTVVNAPKSGAAAKGCDEDRQVDIMSVGAQWREYEPTAAETPKPDATEEMAAVMDSLRRKLAEAEAPPPPAAPEPPPKTKQIAAQPGKQIVAVYMAGQEPAGARGVHNIMGGELARVMSESDKYTAVDRTDAILEQLDREHAYQRSGAVDDEQIKAIGHQLGVEFLCISNINPVGKRYYLDTRLVDVVTAEIARSVTATSTLKDANEMTRVGREVALELLEAEKTRQQRKRRKAVFRGTAVGLDVLGAGLLAYGYIENNNVTKNTKRIPHAEDNGLGHLKNGPEAERAATMRNAGYIIGGVILASGVTIHIMF